MNILWLTNVALPEASLLMNEKITPFGGWFVSASTALAEHDGIGISIAFPKTGLSDILVLNGAKIKFYAFPSVGQKELSFSKNNPHLTKILDEAKPDIVHIFGTEFAHTLAMVNACKERNVKVVIWIQGLISICAQHYMACLPAKLQNKFTFRDFLKQDNLKQQQSKFKELGALEIEALRKVNHVIGRTTWDKACTNQINPNAQYHFCNETLRDEFYKHNWDINQCEKHSIFVSQASYPIKGLHFVLEAMPIILRRFPDTKLYIGGQNITKTDTLKDKLRMSSYGKYIKELIKKYELKNNVVFTGILNEKQMCERYIKSHVFVCPSSIENSPNSLGEAMILGVPCVSSDVGGVVDLLSHNSEGFVYQTDAPYMLGHYISEIFASDNLAVNISKKARGHALRTHNREKNIEEMIKIYNIMLGDDNG
jgi:glycosyltransferase involved in cell wall biosynthesis